MVRPQQIVRAHVCFRFRVLNVIHKDISLFLLTVLIVCVGYAMFSACWVQASDTYWSVNKAKVFLELREAQAVPEH